ncbi:MAG: hypothetical protein LUE89_09525 [Clostridiales bacterium]|nr:hypothetical protein [Clostridiales bacterium]
MTIYTLTSTGPQGCRLTPHRTYKTEDEIRRDRSAGLWLLEHKHGAFALHSLGGNNLYWRRITALDVRCPHCNARMVETSGALDNMRLGTFTCVTCSEYGHPDHVEDDTSIDWDQAVKNLHDRAERMMPKAPSATQKSLQTKANTCDRITFSRETTETLRRMCRNTPANQRIGYGVVTCGIASHVDRLQALNRLGGMAADKDLRAEIAKVRHYNNL